MGRRERNGGASHGGSNSKLSHRVSECGFGDAGYAVRRSMGASRGVARAASLRDW
jgi:hypothetical protein